MELKLNKEKGFWLSTERKGVYHYRKNPCLISSIYHYYQSPSGEEQKQSHKFYKRKLSRAFISELGKYSNSKSCGLYEYCSLLCWALSYSNAKQEKAFGWISKKLPFFVKLFGCKTQADCLQALRRLYEYGLIIYDFDSATSTIDIYVTAAKTDKSTKNNRKAEYTAINKKSGYVFVPDMNIDIIRDKAESYSERDVLVDIWLSILYRDDDACLSRWPIAVFDRYHLEQHITYKELAGRYRCSVGRIHNMFNKFKKSGICTVHSVHKQGAYIFLPSYTSYLWNITLPEPRLYEILSFAMSPKEAARICWNSQLKKVKAVITNKRALMQFVMKYGKSKKTCKIRIHLSKMSDTMDNHGQPLVPNTFIDTGQGNRGYFSQYQLNPTVNISNLSGS